MAATAFMKYAVYVSLISLSFAICFILFLCSTSFSTFTWSRTVTWGETALLLTIARAIAFLILVIGTLVVLLVLFEGVGSNLGTAATSVFSLITSFVTCGCWTVSTSLTVPLLR